MCFGEYRKGGRGGEETEDEIEREKQAQMHSSAKNNNNITLLTGWLEYGMHFTFTSFFENGKRTDAFGFLPNEWKDPLVLYCLQIKRCTEINMELCVHHNTATDTQTQIESMHHINIV